MKIKFLISTFWVLASLGLQAQEDTIRYALPNYVMPSAEQAKLIRSLDIPLSLHKGTANVKIPIYTLNYNGFELPVYLEYNTSGIKVDDQSGTVGLGWRLVAGGKVTRVIKDKLDEGEDGFINGASDNIASMYAKYDSQDDSYYTYMGKDNYKNLDGQPDLFYFETPTVSGKFVFNKDGIPVAANGSAVKIIPDIGSNAEGQLKLIDTNGNQYTFNHKELADVTKSHRWVWGDRRCGYDGGSCIIVDPFSDGSSHDYPFLQNINEDFDDNYLDDSPPFLDFVSTWHLSTVKNYNNEDIFSISYDSEEITEETFTEITEHGTNNYCDFRYPLLYSITKTTKDFTALFVREISATNTKINFEYVQDLGSSSKRLLSKIKISNGNNLIEYDFDYTKYNVGVDDVTSERIFLSSISKNGVSYRSFEYNFDTSKNDKFFRHSPYADMWGYFKDSELNVTTRIPYVPITSSCNAYGSQMIGADESHFIGGQLVRSQSDLESTKMGSLKKMYNEYGGVTEFEYEQNVDEALRVLGGLRISKINKKDNSGAQINQKEFIYEYDPVTSGGRTNSGYVLATPKFYKKFNKISLDDEETEVTVLTSTPINNMYEDIFSITYESVIEKISNNGQIVRTYTLPSSDYYPQKNLYYWHSGVNVEKVFKELGDGVGSAIIIFNDFSGYLKTEKTYSESDELLKEKINLYNKVDVGNYVKGIAWQFGSNSPYEETISLVPIKIHSGRIDLQKTEIHKYKNGIEYLAKNSTYRYNHLGQLQSVEETNELSDITKSIFYTYPSDFSTSFIYKISQVDVLEEYQGCLQCGANAKIINGADEIYNDPRYPQCEISSLNYSAICADIEQLLTNAIADLHSFTDERSLAIWLLNWRNAIAQPVEITTVINGEKLKTTQHLGYQLVLDDNLDPQGPNEAFLYYKVYPKNLSSFGYYDGIIEENISFVTIDEANGNYQYEIDGKYINRQEYKFENKGNSTNHGIKSSKDFQGIITNYKYDANENLRIKYTSTEEVESIYIDDFEGELLSNWASSPTTLYSYCGENSLPADGNFNFSISNNCDLKYTLSFAYKDEHQDPFTISGAEVEQSSVIELLDTWKLFNATLDVQPSATISFSFDQVYIDNFVLIPSSFECSIISQDPLYGVTSLTNKDGLSNFFNYDDKGRIIEIRNHKNELLNQFEYNILGATN